jgi:hypothetical protein
VRGGAFFRGLHAAFRVVVASLLCHNYTMAHRLLSLTTRAAMRMLIARQQTSIEASGGPLKSATHPTPRGQAQAGLLTFSQFSGITSVRTGSLCSLRIFLPTLMNCCSGTGRNSVLYSEALSHLQTKLIPAGHRQHRHELCPCLVWPSIPLQGRNNIFFV